MNNDATIIKGYDQLEKVMEGMEGTDKGLWLTCPDKQRYLYLTFDRVPVINAGLCKHEFTSVSETINYVLEFLYN